MDPSALAQLPLSALVLTAVFFVGFWMFRAAAAFVDKHRDRRAFAQQFRYHVAFSMGSLERLYQELCRELPVRHAALTKLDDDQASKEEKDAFERLLGAIGAFLFPPEPVTGKPRPDAADYVITKGFFDPDKVAEKLLWLPEGEPGLALWLIETRQLIYTIATEVNVLNDKTENKRLVYDHLKLLQSGVAEYLLVSKAILEKSFRPRLAAANGPGAMADLFKQEFPAHEIEVPGQMELQNIQKAVGNVLGPPADPDEIDLSSESLKIFEVDELPSWASLVYAFPALWFAAFVLLVVFYDEVREFFWESEGEPPVVSCSVTIDEAKDVQSVSCTYGADTAEEGLLEGRSVLEEAASE